MHELSIALSIIEIAAEEAEQQGGARATAVHLKLGPLSGVDSEALQSAFGVAIESSPMPALQLVIHSTPITVFCETCDAVRPATSPSNLSCRECGFASFNVVSGRELEVTAMELVE